MRETILLLIAALASSTLLGKSDFDIHILSVSSATYQTDSANTGFDDIPGARRSARLVAEGFSKHTGATQKLLRPETGTPLTREAFFSALKNEIKVLKKRKSKQKLFVLYFCGHGVSEGIAWNQFLVPGNVDTTVKSSGVVEISESMIYVGDISDLLKENDLPFMLLLDCCYEGTPQDFANMDYWVGEEGKQNLLDIAKILKVMNQFKESNPVVFSTPPGTVAPIVQMPGQDDPLITVGPICRRAMLAFKNLSTKHDSFTLMDWVLLTADSEFDPETPRVLSNWEPGETAFSTFSN